MSRYIVTSKDKITRTDTYFVSLLCEDGTELSELEPRRLFPFSDVNRYITLLDSSETEIAMIKDLSAISPDSREAIEACFFDYYMIPKIIDVLEIHDRFGVLKWRVLTDRGEIKFRIQNRHSDIKNLGRRMLLRDSNDNRYQIPDIGKLNKSSLKKIYSYL